MKRILLIFATMLMLQGCIPAAFVAGGAAVAGAIIYDHRSTKTIVQDRDITFQLQHRLDNDPELRGHARLSVTTFNKVVLLLGQASTFELKSKAEAIVKSSSRIKLVYNEITVGKPISEMARANDAWITTKIKTILAATAKLNSTTLKVVTENKVVYLLGLTTRDQAKLATGKARTVSGVSKVVKLFEYIS